MSTKLIAVHSARKMDDVAIILILQTFVAAAQLMWSYYIMSNDLPAVKEKR
jgi:hypothetical protein